MPELPLGQLHVDASAHDVNAQADDPSVRILGRGFVAIARGVERFQVDEEVSLVLKFLGLSGCVPDHDDREYWGIGEHLPVGYGKGAQRILGPGGTLGKTLLMNSR